MTYIALLRGINVGGKAMVPMVELRGLFVELGLTEVRTLLQSGNVIFTAKPGAVSKLEQKLEGAAEKKFGRSIDFFLRTEKEWAAMVAANPYADEARRDPGHLVVLCLKSMPKATALAAFRSAIPGREYFQPGERCLYIYYPDGMGESKLNSALIDRHLGLSGTARNWNTTLKIAAKMTTLLA